MSCHIGNNVDLLKRTNRDPTDVQIRRRKWSWIGHTVRKPATNITRQALKWNPQGRRKRGRTQNSWRMGVGSGLGVGPTGEIMDLDYCRWTYYIFTTVKRIINLDLNLELFTSNVSSFSNNVNCTVTATFELISWGNILLCFCISAGYS